MSKTGRSGYDTATEWLTGKTLSLRQNGEVKQYSVLPVTMNYLQKFSVRYITNKQKFVKSRTAKHKRSIFPYSRRNAKSKTYFNFTSVGRKH